MFLLLYGIEWSRDWTVSLNCSRVGRSTTFVHNLFHCTTERVFIEIQKCMYLTQGKGVAVSCHWGRLLEVRR